MRLNFIMVVFFLVFQSICSQVSKKVEITSSKDAIKTVSFDPVYFVLGTLSDYMGRFQYVEREKQIDLYYPFEKPVVDYLTGYIKTKLNIVVDTIFEKSNRSKMFSDELSKTLNSFYGEKEELLSDKFKTKKQKYSFLVGIYYRYGEKLDSSIYKIQLANSPKHQNCYEFLKEIGCENIFYQYLRNIPAQFVLYFEPVDELKEYLELIEQEKVALKKSFEDQTERFMLENRIKKRKFEKHSQKMKSLEVEKIKNAFNRLDI